MREPSLRGRETDAFASYDNALFGAGYFPGNWCLFTGTTEPTDDTRAIRQPDISTGSGVIVAGDLREDSNPDAAFTPETLDANDWPSGRTIHISPWHPYDVGGHIRVELTTAGAVSGAGNAQRVWARANWTLVGDANAVQVVGDYFRFSENIPSGLKVDLPPEAIPNAPWVKPSGTRYKAETLPPSADYILTDGAVISAEEAKNHDQGDNEEVTLRGDFRVNATNVTHYVTFTEPGGGLPNILKIRIPKTSDPTDDNGLDKTDLERLLQNGAWANIADYLLDITSNATVATIGTSVTFTANYIVLSGTKPTGSDTRKVRIVGEDVHRGELARQSFKQETPSVAGKGGAAGRVWGWVSSVTDAGWRRLLDVLKADASTSAAKAGVQGGAGRTGTHEIGGRIGRAQSDGNGVGLWLAASERGFDGRPRSDGPHRRGGRAPCAPVDQREPCAEAEGVGPAGLCRGLHC